VAAGVAYPTVRQWLARAQEDSAKGISSVYVDFSHTLSRASAEAEVHLASVVANTTDDWRAQAFILERRYRERWGRQDAPTVAVQVVVSDALAAQLADAMRVAAAKPVELEVTAEPASEDGES